MLIKKNRYNKTLAVLWHTVFGDSLDYVNLIFNEKYTDSIICFAELDVEMAVSAFYLIESYIEFDNKYYKGYYLYAAATLPEYRKKGLMSKLINEAVSYCKEKGFDFISLVPSNDGLYNYYTKNGFSESMYRYELKRLTCIAKDNNFGKISAERYYDIRNQKLTDAFHYTSDAFRYAADCLKFAGYNFYENDDSEFFIRDDESDVVEAFSSDMNYLKKIRFGMIYPINDKLKRNWKYTDIYMNIALDQEVKNGLLFSC